jgi:hypothetical protein
MKRKMKIIKMKIESGSDNKVLTDYIAYRLNNLNIKEIEVKDEK